MGKSINFEPPRRRRAALIMVGGGYLNAVITTVQGLLLIPLYLRFIGDHLYGLWLGTGGILAILGCLDMGITSLLIQRLSKSYAKKDADQIASYFYNGLIFYGVLMLLLIGIALVLSIFIPYIFVVTRDELTILRECFILSALGFVLSLGNNVVAGFQQALQRPLFMQVSTNCCSILGLITTILLLLNGFGLRAIPLGFLTRTIPLVIGNFVFALFLLNEMHAKFRLEWKIIHELKGLSSALFAAKFGTSLVGQIEPTLIACFISPELATSFVITKKVTAILDFGLNTLVSAIYPGFAHLYGEGRKGKASVLYTQVIGTMVCLSAMVYSLYLAGNHSFIGLWVGERQFAGETVTLFIALGCFSAMLLNFNSYLISATGDFKVPSLMIAVEAVFRLIMMLALIFLLGLIGLLLAIIITTLTFNILFCQRLKKHFPADFWMAENLVKLFSSNLLLFLIAFGASSIVTLHSWANLIFYLMGMTILFLLMVGNMNPEVRVFCRNLLIRQKLNPVRNNF